MRLKKLIIATLTSVALFSALNTSANAALVAVTTAPTPGNDSLSVVNTLIANATTFLGKYETVNCGPLIAIDGVINPIADYISLDLNRYFDAGKVNFDLSSTGFEFDYVSIKAGNEFRLFEWTGDAAIGSFMISTMMADLLNPNGRASEISHISFFGSTGSAVPIPGAALFFMTAMGAGISARRNSRQNGVRQNA